MSLKRKLSALIIASIGITSLPSPSHALSFDMGDEIYRKTHLVSALALSLVAVLEASSALNIWDYRTTMSSKIDALGSLKKDAEDNKTIETSNYPFLSYNYTSFTDNVTYTYIPCCSDWRDSQQKSSSTEELFPFEPLENFFTCIDNEIQFYQNELSKTNLLMPKDVSLSITTAALAALNIFAAVKGKNYLIKHRNHYV